MEMMKNLFILLVGFILLIKGADFFVDGSSAAAKRLHIPALIIGLTIVAMGTSLPELSVSVISSLHGNNSLAVSNVVGSNIFNLMVVLGASAIIRPLNVNRHVIHVDYPISIACAVTLFVLGWIGMSLDRIDGLIFIILFIIYLVYTVKDALKVRRTKGLTKAETKEEKKETQDIKLIPMWQAVLYIVGGAIAVKYGGDFVVDSATFIAEAFGMSETLIGLTIVACGTSLPELFTSIQAARKHEADLAVGNVIGSNIFNILLILGVAGILSPIDLIMENFIDLIVLVVFSAFVLVFCRRKHKIDRSLGLIMLAAYGIYLVYICLR